MRSASIDRFLTATARHEDSGPTFASEGLRAARPREARIQIWHSEPVRQVPGVVRNKAIAIGATRWLDELPELITDIERDWSITVGRSFEGATEAFVAEVTLRDGVPAVLKLLIDRPGTAAANEINFLRMTDGQGCVQMLRSDVDRGAMLLERLGPSLDELNLPIAVRHEIMCATVQRVWRPAPDSGLPSGADKGRWLVDYISTTWEELARPCALKTVEYALACAHRRIEAHDDERAVLVHGDVHQWNTLRANGDFKLVDPDGLLAEAEYDMGVLMREDPLELLEDDPHDRSRWLAQRTGLDATAIWEWGVAERVSTGLLLTNVGLQPHGRDMLAVADHLAV
jgi:streptomycin 6-kinase